MKMVSRIGALVLAAVSVFSGGCVYTETKSCTENDKPIRLGVNWGIGLDSINYDVGLGKLETPLETFDPGLKYEQGRGTIYIQNGKGNIAPKLKLESFLETKDIMVELTADATYRDVVYGTSRPGEPSGGTNGNQPSTDYVQLKQGFTYIPSIGVKKALPKHLLLGVEAGFPYTEFGVRTGYIKWDRGEWYKQFSWNGFGSYFGGSIGWYESNMDESISLSVKQERYKPVFDGERAKIDAFVFCLDFRHDF